LGVTLGACGGSHKTATHNSTHATTTHTQAPKAPPKPIVQEVRGPGGGAYSSSIVAHPGEQLVLHTLISGQGTQNVSLAIPAGPGKSLAIVATIGSHTSSANVASADGKPLTLTQLRYSCSLPPAPSFCPAHATSHDHSYSVRFATTRAAGVTLLALVGPVAKPVPTVRNPGSAVVPPYTVTELVRAVPAHGGAPPKSALPTGSATVRPGDSLVMISRVTSRLRGATQPITVTVDQGPATSVVISAHASGGQTSTATIKSGTGSPITLVLPRYLCYLPPYPTFCPAISAKVASHRYSLTFAAAPGTSPPVVLATVEAG
jgi:hypothetical protein